MCSLGPKFGCGSIRPLLSLVVLLGLVAAPECRAAIFTNTITGAKYTERLARTVKFVHAGPVIGDFALLNDRGTFTIQGTLSLEGLGELAFTPFSEISVTLASLEQTEFFLAFSPVDDPTFSETGLDTTAKVTQTGVFGGRTQVVSTASVKLNPLAETLRVKVTGRLLGATVAPDTALEQAGEAAVADRLIGLPSQEVSEAIVLNVLFDNGLDTVVGSVLLNVGGTVKTTPRTDREIGTFNASVVGLAGLPTRTRE